MYAVTYQGDLCIVIAAAEEADENQADRAESEVQM